MTPDDVRARRERLGMTQAQLAQALNTSRLSVSNWETGRHPVPGWLTLALEALTLRAIAADRRAIVSGDPPYVYIRSEPRLWTVGFYGPDGKWHPESDFADTEDAAARVAYLNGGGRPDEWVGGGPYGPTRVRQSA